MMYSKETDETSMLIYLGAKFSLPLFFPAELRIDEDRVVISFSEI